MSKKEKAEALKKNLADSIENIEVFTDLVESKEFEQLCEVSAALAGKYADRIITVMMPAITKAMVGIAEKMEQAMDDAEEVLTEGKNNLQETPMHVN